MSVLDPNTSPVGCDICCETPCCCDIDTELAPLDVVADLPWELVLDEDGDDVVWDYVPDETELPATGDVAIVEDLDDLPF